MFYAQTAGHFEISNNIFSLKTNDSVNYALAQDSGTIDQINSTILSIRNNILSTDIAKVEFLGHRLASGSQSQSSGAGLPAFSANLRQKLLFQNPSQQSFRVDFESLTSNVTSIVKTGGSISAEDWLAMDRDGKARSVPVSIGAYEYD